MLHRKARHVAEFIQTRDDMLNRANERSGGYSNEIVISRDILPQQSEESYLE